MRFPLGLADRAVFIGLPGWGKTTLVQQLLEPVQSAVVIDPKGDPQEWRAWGRRHGYTVTTDPRVIARLPGDPARGPQPAAKVIWLVDSLWISDRGGWRRKGQPGYMWTDGLTRIYARGHTLAVFDDALTTLPAGVSHPSAKKIITAGRSTDVGAWIVAQAPLWLDTIALRVAEHCFAFTQPSEEWRAKLSSDRGLDCSELATLEQFEFAYHRHGRKAWELCQPISRRGLRAPRTPVTNTDQAAAQDQNGEGLCTDEHSEECDIEEATPVRRG